MKRLFLSLLALASCTPAMCAPVDPVPPPVTDPVVVVTDPPAPAPTDPVVVVTPPPVTDPPSTEPAPTDPPVTDPPVTDPPVTAPPSTVPAPSFPYEIPAPGVGTSAGGTIPSGSIQRPSNDTTGNFRTNCWFSHMNYDDPIIFPGQPGASHLHTFFGNTGVTAATTTGSLISSGNSTCDGGTLNRSSYWVPSVIDSDGDPVVPSRNMVYYKSGYQGVDPADIVTVLPVGLKVIAGNPRAAVEQPSFVAEWSCTEGPSGRYATIPDCPAGSILHLILNFPQCWDGVNLDSYDHKSHMAYGTWGVGCPASHPVPLPAITYTIDWPAHESTRDWFLSSDMGATGGLTIHGDLFTGWDPATSTAFLTNCTTKNADCHVGTIADGVSLIWGVR